MNGVRNAVFIVFLMVILVVVDYMYTISDVVVEGAYTEANIIQPNDITTLGLTMYQNMRGMMYTLITGIMVPYLVFLCMFSSLVNRNQNVAGYLLSSMVILLATPMFIYFVGEIITNMLSVSILDTDYMYTTMLSGSNFMLILVANLLLALASFVFVRREVQYA